MSLPVRKLFVHACILLTLTAVFGLWQSLFFAQWEGTVVSYRPPPEGGAKTAKVLLVEPSKATREFWWPSQRVIDLQLPADPLAVPPIDIPELFPTSSKERFTLHYVVKHTPEEGTKRSAAAYPTTSPEGVSLTLVFLGIALIARNMIATGHPFLFMPGPMGKKRRNRTARPQSPSRKSRSQHGPPPSGRQKGRGRR